MASSINTRSIHEDHIKDRYLQNADRTSRTLILDDNHIQKPDSNKNALKYENEFQNLN
jgi:hypothetical protein